MIESTLELQYFLRSRLGIINEWFNEKINFIKEKSIPFPLFSSFDVRDSGYKASIVDSNVFPSGFNNLDLTSCDLASKKVSKYLSSISPKIFLNYLTIWSTYNQTSSTRALLHRP